MFFDIPDCWMTPVSSRILRPSKPIILKSNTMDLNENSLRKLYQSSKDEQPLRQTLNEVRKKYEAKEGNALSITTPVNIHSPVALSSELQAILEEIQLSSFSDLNKDYSEGFKRLKAYLSSPSATAEEIIEIASRCNLPLEVLQYVARLVLGKNLLRGNRSEEHLKEFYRKVVFTATDYEDFRERMRTFRRS